MVKFIVSLVSFGLIVLNSAFSSGSCPLDWISYMSNCYKFVDVSNRFYDASLWCRNEQSELVSISSDEENDFINQKLVTRGDSWIGLYKKTCVVIDVVQWLDGNKATFSKFFNGDPKEPNDEVCCIRTTPNGWKDKSCFDKFPFTCKRPSELTRIPYKQMKKMKSNSYLKSPNIAIIEIQKCTALQCLLRCMDVFGCNGFNIKKIPLQNSCTCEIKGSESWQSFQIIEAEGSEFWMDTMFPMFFRF